MIGYINASKMPMYYTWTQNVAYMMILLIGLFSSEDDQSLVRVTMEYM